MTEQTLLAYLDGEVSEEEALQVEEQLQSDPSLSNRLAQLCRESFIYAETLLETALPSADSQEACPACHAQPSVDAPPNEDLFTDYLEGNLSPADMQDMEDQLRKDPALEKELASYCRQRCLLADTLGEVRDHTAEAVQSGSRAAPAKHTAKRSRPKSGRVVRLDPRRASGRPGRSVGRIPYAGPPAPPANRVGKTLLKTAALLIGLIGGGLLIMDQFTPASPQPEDPVASITHSSGSVIVVRADYSAGAPRTSTQTVGVTKVSAGRPVTLAVGDAVVISDGMAEVRYDGEDTLMEVRSYSTVRFRAQNGAKQIHLERGLLQASVDKQPEGRPMSFSTPHADIKVLGTAFLLKASEDRTQLEMQEGTVSVSHVDSNAVGPVRAGESMLADSAQIRIGGLGPQITGFTLYDADTKAPIPGLDPIQPGATLTLSQLRGKKLTIGADTLPTIMRKVNLTLSGPSGFETIHQTERFYPYLVTENSASSHWEDALVYNPLPPLKLGAYSLKAEAVTPSGRTVSRTLFFSVR